MNIDIQPATPVDALELSFCLRKSDLHEIEASSGRAPFEVLLDGVEHSTECWTARVDGGVMAIWGVASALPSLLGPRIGVAWMLGSDLVDAHREAFLPASRAELERLLTRWDVLINAIDARNTKALRWANRLGFQLAAPQPMGHLGLEFVRFTVTAEDLRNVRTSDRSHGCSHGCDCSHEDVLGQPTGELRG